MNDVEIGGGEMDKKTIVLVVLGGLIVLLHIMYNIIDIIYIFSTEEENSQIFYWMWLPSLAYLITGLWFYLAVGNYHGLITASLLACIVLLIKTGINNPFGWWNLLSTPMIIGGYLGGFLGDYKGSIAYKKQWLRIGFSIIGASGCGLLTFLYIFLFGEG
jgi:hypothetical protein